MNIEEHFCLDESPHFHMMELDAVDSTNNFLKHYKPLRTCRLTLVSAEYQSAGRGADTNTWESERGSNLLFSLLVQPADLEAPRVFTLSEVLALSVCNALCEFKLGFTVKWPNDIYYGDGKVAGLLIENDLAGRNVQRAVLGVGINVNQTTFVSGAPNPLSLAQILGQPQERRFVLERVVKHFNALFRDLERGAYESIHAQYLDKLYRRGGQHEFEDAQGRFLATITTVEPGGHLILRDARGAVRRYAFKEVRYIL